MKTKNIPTKQKKLIVMLNYCAIKVKEKNNEKLPKSFLNMTMKNGQMKNILIIVKIKYFLLKCKNFV